MPDRSQPRKSLYWVEVTTCLLLLGAIIQFSHARIATLMARAASNSGQDTLQFPKATVLKFFSLGYDQLLADCWWLSFIQYYGDNKARLQDHYRYAYDYLDLITQLDPRFTQPYWFAAFAVGNEQNRPDLASKLIERGLQANQNDWYLPFIAGINQYLFVHDDIAAAKYYRQASRYPEAPRWLEPQARLLQMNIPKLFKEINTWEMIYNSNNDVLVKNAARKRLIDLLSQVYRQAPVESARQRAKQDLKVLGVDIDN